MLFYPEDFKKRVKETYPECVELHRKLDEGSEDVGDILYRFAPKGLRIDTILVATSLEELQNKAKEAMAQNELYNEWAKLYANERYI